MSDLRAGAVVDTLSPAHAASQPAPRKAKRGPNFHALRLALALLPEQPPLELGKCRAVRALLPEVADTRLRGVLLSMALRDAISVLRPQADLPADNPRWWPYHICLYEYVEGRSRGEVEEMLAISKSTYTRAKRRALERIAAQIPQLLAEACQGQASIHREAAR
jgi:hypothetical protein